MQWLIFLADLFLNNQRQMSDFVYQCKEDDAWYEQFKTAQKVLNKQVMTKEAQLSSSKSRQTVLDLTSLGKRTVTGEMKTVESKTLDSAIANYFYENALPFNVADSPSLAHMVEMCIEFSQQHPGRKYKSPNRMRICGVLLDSAYKDTASSIQPIMDRAKRYGATSTSDGWSDVQRRLITNFMLVTRESAFNRLNESHGREVPTCARRALAAQQRRRRGDAALGSGGFACFSCSVAV